MSETSCIIIELQPLISQQSQKIQSAKGHRIWATGRGSMVLRLEARINCTEMQSFGDLIRPSSYTELAQSSMQPTIAPQDLDPREQRW